MNKSHWILWYSVACLVGCCFTFGAEIASAAPYGVASDDLTQLDLESLMQLEVTSVSRKEESVLGASAAIYVITAEDIAHSPATTIPQLLRYVPGLQVAEIDTGQWAVSARGFNTVFANKLLVMIDGRSIYTPLFSGVFWDSHDVVLEDIERIEVIRGPGAVMWGANAVNGIINIITKKAKDTAGVLVSALGGNEERGTGVLRYGTSIDDHSAIRVYSKYRNIDSGQFVASNDDSYSDLEDVRGGFRYDYIEGRNNVLVSGELMRGDPQNNSLVFPSNPPSVHQAFERGSYTGGSLLGRWTRELSSSDSLSTQMFFDREARDDLVLKSTVNILDYELNYRTTVAEIHNFVFGANYRWMEDALDSTETVFFPKDSRQVSRASLFAQDEIGLFEKSLLLTVGAKLEYQDFVGLEPQPNIRAAWRISPVDTIWAAASYASRLPSRSENDVIVSQGVASSADAVSIYRAFGNTGVRSEHVAAFELGYRSELTHWISVDVASYYNRYRDLSTVSAGMPSIIGMAGTIPIAEVPLNFGNAGDAESLGLELSTVVSPAKWISIQSGANIMDIDYNYPTGAQEGAGGGVQGSDPRHQIFARVKVLPLEEFDVIAQARYVDSLPAFHISSYIQGDLRLAYRPWRGIELSLNGNNLFDQHQREFVPQGVIAPPAYIERSVWGALQVKF